MRTLARSVYLDSEFGVEQELPRAGTGLENPFVYDDAAKEMKALAAQGLVEIMSERRSADNGALIITLRFKRVR